MTTTFPFLSAYDPPGTSEGTLDPLGLYQIADQLAVQLVPAIRERMQRVRFLTAMAVGAMVTEGLEDDPRHRDASPYLVWEWLVVEAMIREMRDDPSIRGVPGTLVTQRAMNQHGYLDARSYLKTPRIFGFNGVYKRLAIHLGLVNVHLGIGPNAEELVHAWARDLGWGGLEGAKQHLTRWRTAVSRSLNENPPHTHPGWNKEAWVELAQAFAPSNCKGWEKRYLRELLLAQSDRRIGALPAIWQLQAGFDGEEVREESLHDQLEKHEPAYGPLLRTIRTYERFARSLQDAFDVLRAEAARPDALGFAVPDIARDRDFRLSVKDLHLRYEKAHQALAEITPTTMSLQNRFSEWFGAFSEPMEAGVCALALCTHHQKVQRAKSAEGKNPWFDCIGPERIYIRHAYRQPRPEIQPDRYVHFYRGNPIRRFYSDLT